jgi:demethylspheroidene O-methyltransferase
VAIKSGDKSSYWSYCADRWRHIRNQLIASPGFQKWAFKIPGIRTIARHRANSLFDVVAGFVYSQILYACVRLDLFNLLDKQPRSVRDLMTMFDMPEDSVICLLKAASSLDLVEVNSDGCYTLGPQGAAIIANPWLVAMVEHHALLYADLADPVRMLKGQDAPGQLASYWPYAGTEKTSEFSSEDVAAYSDLMAQSQQAIAQQILDAYPFSRHQKVLDVGGGEGAFLCAVLKRHLHLRGALMDLPAVAARAANRFADAGLAQRTEIHSQSFLSDSWPSDEEMITLVRILHDHDDGPVEAILCAAYKALRPGGTLLIAEPMAGTPGSKAAGHGYFGFYLKAMGSGRPRTKPEIETLALNTGFTNIKHWQVTNPMMLQVLTVNRP